MENLEGGTAPVNDIVKKLLISSNIVLLEDRLELSLDGVVSTLLLDLSLLQKVVKKLTLSTIDEVALMSKLALVKTLVGRNETSL